MTVPRLAVTLGDPAGIGPEVLVKAFAASRHPKGSFRWAVLRTRFGWSDEDHDVAVAQTRAPVAGGARSAEGQAMARRSACESVGESSRRVWNKGSARRRPRADQSRHFQKKRI